MMCTPFMTFHMNMPPVGIPPRLDIPPPPGVPAPLGVPPPPGGPPPLGVPPPPGAPPPAPSVPPPPGVPSLSAVPPPAGVTGSLDIPPPPPGVAESSVVPPPPRIRLHHLHTAITPPTGVPPPQGISGNRGVDSALDVLSQPMVYSPVYRSPPVYAQSYNQSGYPSSFSYYSQHQQNVPLPSMSDFQPPCIPPCLPPRSATEPPVRINYNSQHSSALSEEEVKYHLEKWRIPKAPAKAVKAERTERLATPALSETDSKTYMHYRSRDTTRNTSNGAVCFKQEKKSAERSQERDRSRSSQRDHDRERSWEREYCRNRDHAYSRERDRDKRYRDSRSRSRSPSYSSHRYRSPSRYSEKEWKVRELAEEKERERRWLKKRYLEEKHSTQHSERQRFEKERLRSLSCHDDNRNHAKSGDSNKRIRSPSRSSNHSPRDSESRSHRESESRSHRESESRSHRESESRSHRESESRSHREFESRSHRESESRSHRESESRSHRESSHLSKDRAKLRKPLTDREKILEEYRKNYCRTSDDLAEKIEQWSREHQSEDEEGTKLWYRSSPAELYYKRIEGRAGVEQTKKLEKLVQTFFTKLIERGRKARPEVDELPPLIARPRMCSKHGAEDSSSSSSSSSDDDDLDEDGLKGYTDRIMLELERKQNHPRRLHPEMWFNNPGEMNGGPLCRCSIRARRFGMRHGVYAGEQAFPKCSPRESNIHKLFHYRITVSPPTNFLIKNPTIIGHDEHEFLFSGFSMFSHFKLAKLPTCKVIRFNIEYTILYVEEPAPENFTVQELDYFEEFIFTELLELVDLDLGRATETSCSQFHFMPRFVRLLAEGGCEVLSMCEVMKYMIEESQLLIPPETLNDVHSMDHYNWQKFVDRIKGMIVTYPGKKPCSVRVDQLDRSPPVTDDKNKTKTDVQKHFYPEIVHFGIRPPQLSYAGNPEYQKAWRYYVKYRHLIANMPKPTYRERSKLAGKEAKLQEMRTQSKMKRDVTVAISSEGFHTTGLMCDVVQHAMLIPVLVRHLRFHKSLEALENRIGYVFKQRLLLQTALTHPSYRENFGTNPDHARNSLTNCGIRQPEYGDRRIHYTRKKGNDMEETHPLAHPSYKENFGTNPDLPRNSLTNCGIRQPEYGDKRVHYTRKKGNDMEKTRPLTHPSYRENFGTNPDHARNSLTNCGIRQPEYGDWKIHYTREEGIVTLINIMSRFGKSNETESEIKHNERLEFLGDAVVEFISSIHLFRMFPTLAEGGLATYRASIVQNQHLAQLAKNIELEQFMLYAHGSDLCRDVVMKHAMANCFEALMGALFLDAGLQVADRVFALALWYNEPDLYKVWLEERPHPLQEQEPLGDRRYIEDFEFLQKLTEFETSIGVEFKHIRLLARAFTDRSVGFTHLTLGSNQRLEFLGDTVLQLVVSDKLYRHFPDHHEGHLSLLRSSLVNNRTQAMVCDDLNMASYAIYNNPKAKPTTKKHKADLLEAFLGALYIDKSLDYCIAFCKACLFPRLQDFIMNQDWNDPKSKLQQCCLTLRSMEGGEPDIPLYKVIECMGPTNTRVYTVGVYFRGIRLASARGHSIQEAEMNAAEQALSCAHQLFPQLDHQKRVIAKSMRKKRKGKSKQTGSRTDAPRTDDKVPKAYRLDQVAAESDDSSPAHSDEGAVTKTGDDSGLDSDPESVPKDKLDSVQVSTLVSDMEKVKAEMIRKNEYEKLKEKCKQSESDEDA